MTRRQVVLDTETTGMPVEVGHRILDIACIELIDRRLSGRTFASRLNPDREIDPGAIAIHGLTAADISDAPRFPEINAELWAFLHDAELIIHNAPFDLAFLDSEFGRCGRTISIADACSITDTLAMARRLHPGQSNSLDALCRRYAIDASARARHGALVDATLLAHVYLAMTGGQSTLDLDKADSASETARRAFLLALNAPDRAPLLVIRASEDELKAHSARMLDVRTAHMKALKRKIDDLASQLKKLAESEPIDQAVMTQLEQDMAITSAELGEIESGRRPLF